jgi:hypothetical protein
MNRWMAGGAGVVLSAGLLVALAAPGLAQEEPEYHEFQGEADVEPVEPQPGDQVTVSDDRCHDGTSDLWWALQPIAGGSILEVGQEPLAEDGSWEVTFLAPDESGDYLFFGLCLPPGVDEPDLATIDRVQVEDVPVDLLQEWGVDALTYYAMVVQVAAVDPSPAPMPDPSTTTTTTPGTPAGAPAPAQAPAAPTARPVPADPTFVG